MFTPMVLFISVGFYNSVAVLWSSFTYLTEIQEEWNFLVFVGSPISQVSVGSAVTQVKGVLSRQSTNCGKVVPICSQNIFLYSRDRCTIHSYLILNLVEVFD